MRVRLTLPAGAPGTKRLVEEYGERLICVRYRYDEKRRRRLKTAEIVVDDVPWAPSPQAESHQLVYVAIEYREWELRERIKEAGGSWHRARRVWVMTYGSARQLGVDDRIVGVHIQE